MAGKNERQRRQAREKFRRQQELRMARRQQLRKRWLIGGSAVLAVALIASLLAVFLPGGGTKKAAASPRWRTQRSSSRFIAESTLLSRQSRIRNSCRSGCAGHVRHSRTCDYSILKRRGPHGPRLFLFMLEAG